MLLMYEENQAILETAISRWSASGFPVAAVQQLMMDGDLADSSGNQHHARAEGAKAVAGRHGFDNTAYQFNGVADVVRGQYSSGLSFDNAITLSLWFNAEPKGGQGGVLIDVSGKQSSSAIVLSESGQLRAGTSLAGKAATELVSAKTYNDGHWHHVAYIVDEKGSRLFVDGVLDVSKKSAAISLGNIDAFSLGGKEKSSQHSFKGRIDELRVYDRRLNQDEVAALASPTSEAVSAYKAFQKDFKMALNTSATNPIIVRKFMKAKGPDADQEVQKRAVLSSGFFDVSFIAHSFKVMAGFVADATIQSDSAVNNYVKNAQVMGFVRSANQAKTISGYKDDYSPQTANLLWNFEDMLPYVRHSFKPQHHAMPGLQAYSREQLQTILDTSHALVVNQEAILGADGGHSTLVDLIGSARRVMMEGRKEVLHAAYRAKDRAADSVYQNSEDLADLNAVLQNLALLADYSFRARRAYNKISPGGPLFFAVNTLNYGIDDGPNRGAYYHITKIRALADVSGLVPLASAGSDYSPQKMAMILEDRIHRLLQSYQIMVGVEVYTVRTAVEYLAKYSQMDFFDEAAKLLADPTLLPYQMRAAGIPFRQYDAMTHSIGMDIVKAIDGVAAGLYARKDIELPPSITAPAIEALMQKPCAGFPCEQYQQLVASVAECCASAEYRVQTTSRLNDLKFALALQQKTAQQQTRSLQYMTPTRLNLLYKSLYRKPYVDTGWKEVKNSAGHALRDVARQIEIAGTTDKVITPAMVEEAVAAAIDSVEAIIGGDDASYSLYHLLSLSFNGRNANTWAFDNLWRYQDPAGYNADTGEDNREYPFNLMPTHLPVTPESYIAAKQLTASSWGQGNGNKDTSYTNVFLDDSSAHGMPDKPEQFRTLLTADPEERGLQDNMSYRTLPAQLGQIIRAIKTVGPDGQRAYVHFWDLNSLLADFSRQTWKRWSYAFHEAYLPGAFDRAIYQPWALQQLSLNAVDGSKALSQWYSAGRVNQLPEQDTYFAALDTVHIAEQLKLLLSMEAISSARMVNFRKQELNNYSQLELDGTVKTLFEKAGGCADEALTLASIDACAERVFQ